MGFAFTKMYSKYGFIKARITLGFFWGLWHLPVIDFLGAASPHGKYLLLFFLSFIAILTAIRLIIAWLYSHTGSILLAQFMHAVSTGCLATFGPVTVSPAQEALWYALYAAVIWLFVIVVFKLKKNNTQNHGLLFKNINFKT